MERKKTCFVKRICACCMVAVLMFTLAFSTPVKFITSATVKVKSIRVEDVEGTVKIVKGKSFVLEPEVNVVPNSKKNRKVTYESKNKKIATVNAKGKIVGKKYGLTRIVIRSKVNPNKKKVIKVKVVHAVSSITLNYNTLTISEDDEDVSLEATVNPKDAINEFEWSTSDDEIVDVDDDGYLFPQSPGTATITVTATDGSNKKASCKVTVTEGTDDDEDDDEEDEDEDDD